MGVSAELEPEPIHIMTLKQLAYEADETRPEPHAQVQAGFVSVALDAAIRSDERRSTRTNTHMHVVSCLFGCSYNIQNVQRVTSKAIWNTYLFTFNHDSKTTCSVSHAVNRT